MQENEKIKQLLTAIEFANDQTAYKKLFVMLHPRLKQFAYSILKSGEEAEELVSDLFIGIWQRRDKLSLIEAPLFYFYSTAKNLALNRIKKQKKLKVPPPEEWFIQLNSISFDPEKLMMTAEMHRKIREAVSSLPPRCKVIYKLIKEDGLKYKEVAELLHLSIKTVEAQMAIALRRLSQCMQMEINELMPKHLPIKKS